MQDFKIKHTKKCDVCGRYQNRPVVVDGIVINDKNELLLIKRGREPYKNFYAFPGGFVDWNETAKEAIVREVKEETNLDVKILYFLNYYDEIERDEKRRTVALVFVCKVKENSDRLKAGDDASFANFFPLNELPQLAFDHSKIVKDYTCKTLSLKKS